MFHKVCYSGTGWNVKRKGKKMKLWYSSPARQWCEALPVGNGRLGGMVYGGCAHELIKLNEDSIWSGKALDRINPDALENLQKIREMLHDGQIEEAERLAMCALSGVPDSQRAYQPAGLPSDWRRRAGKAFPLTAVLAGAITGRTKWEGKEIRSGLPPAAGKVGYPSASQPVCAYREELWESSGRR